MSKNQNKNEAITDMNKDFTQWYTDVVKKAELIDYSPVRGCVVLRPYGYGIWELIQKQLDTMFKETGHENVYMPMFIPKSLLQKEADHVEGFAPEVLTITKAGEEDLADPLCIRPTSEVLFCEHFKDAIQSYRDLPKLYNQWCSVVRWEKTTRPFLRTTEFLWQEGHTAHATEEEARLEAKNMLEVYKDFFENVLAIPVIRGLKSEKEKFAGAVETYTIESMMHDGKALQSGTSHYLGNGFAKAFDITFTDKENKLTHVHQTSWGVSTRMIGGLIMVHGDNNGLILPPKIAPTQVIIIPIAQNKEGVINAANSLYEKLKKDFRIKLDTTDKTPGFKFSEYEMKGVPLRLELGPKDIEAGQAVLARRDNGEKKIVSLENIEKEIAKILEEIQKSLYEKAKEAKEAKTYKINTMNEFAETITNKQGFIKAMWCESGECEEKIKKDFGATIRCLPYEQEIISETCICCNSKASKQVIFAKAY
ncbi:MAG: proline--tRNA ligase [Defluviitaleaceae bacterium]|nr:proline--tRNA ligase [Defluviitaleaceae bacterium]